jgi:hypothetical protein
VIERLDFQSLQSGYPGAGADSYLPRMMLFGNYLCISAMEGLEKADIKLDLLSIE